MGGLVTALNRAPANLPGAVANHGDSMFAAVLYTFGEAFLAKTSLYYFPKNFSLSFEI